MTFGEKLAKARKNAGMTQEDLAAESEVSFQAVSTWERDENLPDVRHLTRLAEILDLSVDALLSSDIDRSWEYDPYPFDAERMYTYVKAKAQEAELTQTLMALPVMREKHEGQYRSPRQAKIPYRTHPLTLACHALAMGIRDDDIIAAALLHDVVEDTNTDPEDLPVGDRVKKTVRLVSYNTYQGEKASIKPAYYAGIKADTHASLIKCLDRCDNLSMMACGFPRKKMAEYVNETEKHILPLLSVIKNVPGWNDAAWLLRYQMLTLLETFKRLL